MPERLQGATMIDMGFVADRGRGKSLLCQSTEDIPDLIMAVDYGTTLFAVKAVINGEVRITTVTLGGEVRRGQSKSNKQCITPLLAGKDGVVCLGRQGVEPTASVLAAHDRPTGSRSHVGNHSRQCRRKIGKVTFTKFMSDCLHGFQMVAWAELEISVSQSLRQMRI